MRKNTLALVEELKQNNQDFEFYPTTQPMIDLVKYRMKSKRSGFNSIEILEIGCGDGRVISQLGEKGDKRFVIEKSQILLNQLPNDLIILGTDFDECNLIDKQVDVIFCNPPYSVFEEWTDKIIRTAEATSIYLIIPERWKNSKLIQLAIKDVSPKTVEVIGSFDFLDADRQARAKVDIVEITFSRYDKKAFDRFFNAEFSELLEAFENKIEDKDNGEYVKLVKTGGITELVESYNNDLNTLYQNYLAISKLDRQIFQELNIELRTLKESLKKRLSGLKDRYWNILFNVYEPITSRLTTKTRDKVLSEIRYNSKSVDFTVSNCFAITNYVVKMSSKYLDDQLVDLFYDLADYDNVVKYKSNEQVFAKDRYRYFNSDNKYTHFKLEYRIITTDKGGFHFDYNLKRYILKRAYSSRNTYDFVQDLMIVGRNLGFNVSYSEAQLNEIEWDYGKRVPLYFTNLTTGEQEIFLELKFYKNGNAHLFFNPKFMLNLNVNVGRILGWVKSTQEASEELGEKIEDIEQAISSNFRLTNQMTNLLLTNKA